jgi:hypothetical protein
MYVIRDMVYFYSLQDWIVSPMLNLLKRTMTYPGFELGTFGLAASIPNHYTIKVAHVHLGHGLIKNLVFIFTFYEGS